MHRLPISLLLAFFFCTMPALAQSPAEPFTIGLEAFKKGAFSQSREQFSQLLQSHPRDPLLLYNLGLVELSDNHPGRALAYWRKALYLKPGYSPVLAGMARLQAVKGSPLGDTNPFLWLYWRVSIEILLGGALILFVLTGFFWVRFTAARKFEKPASPWGLALSALGFAAITGLAVHNFQLLHQNTKATVMETAVPAHSSPSAEAPSLFEFREGDEVVVRRSQDEWIQVQKSATAVGWVKKNQVLVHSGT